MRHYFPEIVRPSGVPGQLRAKLRHHGGHYCFSRALLDIKPVQKLVTVSKYCINDTVSTVSTVLAESGCRVCHVPSRQVVRNLVYSDDPVRPLSAGFTPMSVLSSLQVSGKVTRPPVALPSSLQQGGAAIQSSASSACLAGSIGGPLTDDT